MPEENKKADPTENSSVSIFSLFFDMLGTMLMAVFILLLLLYFAAALTVSLTAGSQKEMMIGSTPVPISKVVKYVLN